MNEALKSLEFFGMSHVADLLRRVLWHDDGTTLAERLDQIRRAELVVLGAWAYSRGQDDGKFSRLRDELLSALRTETLLAVGKDEEG